jgi:hypothetical protein
MRATEWVVPGEGVRVEVLWGVVSRSPALKRVNEKVRKEFLGHGEPDEGLKKKVTRLQIRVEDEGSLDELDVMRATAAIWEY